MHREQRTGRIAGVVLAVAILGLSGAAHAVGTASNTSISNSATVNFDVGSTAQAAVTSAAATFVVDHLVDLTVQEVSAGYTVVATGGVTEVLTFTVTNTGNATMDFLLTATNQAGGADPFGGTDNFDAPVGGTSGIFVDSNGNGAYDAGVDTATFVDQLAQDTTSPVIFVVRDIGAQADGDVSAIALTAQAADGSAVGIGAALTEDLGADVLAGPAQVVFGDGAGDIDVAGDGLHSDTDAFLVGAANISVTKASLVVSDPFNGTTNPKAIPGAVVEYTVTISNAGTATATATNVTISDDLTTEIATNGTVAFDTNAYGAGQGIQLTPPGGGATALTNAVDPDQGDFTANVVTVNGITLTPGDTATVKFRVTIQ